MSHDEILHDDTYRVFVPIEEHDLLKSVEIDENGDYIVQGVMTSDNKDEEDDSITPEGMDCSYFLDKGWIKYEHGNNPNQFIGEPIEIKVGQFEHPTKHSLVKGIFVKGRLFAQRELAKQAIRTIEDLQKSHTKRKMGWSIEGNVKERDRKTGKIVKSVLRNVVLTMNPVNTMTWAELAKSFAKNHELIIDMDMEKAMDLGATAAVNTQSIEGFTPSEDSEEDGQEKWIKLFREFVKKNMISKSLRSKFINGTASTVGMTAYAHGLSSGLDNEGAYEFASYIADRHEVLKSLFRTNFGGEKMKSDKLASLLDADLEELQKSLDDEDEKLEKAVKPEGKEDPEDDEEGEGKGKKKEDDEEEEGKEKEDDEEEEGKEDDEESEKSEKSLKTDFAKSFSKDDSNATAMEVSDFLTNLVDEIGFSIDGFAKSMTHVTKQQNAIIKAFSSVGELVKSMAEQIDELKTANADLNKSFNDLLEKPVGRKSVVSTREVATLKKGIETAGEGKPLTRAAVSDLLVKSFEAGEIPGSTVSRFEAGMSLSELNLPKSVLTKLGL